MPPSRQPTWRAVESRLGAVAFALLVPFVAFAAAPMTALAQDVHTVEAVVDAERGEVSGVLRLRLEEAPEDGQITLWLYAARLMEAPRTLTEIDTRYTFPRRPNVGEVDVPLEAVRVDGAPAEVERRARAADGHRDLEGDLLILHVPEEAREIEVPFSIRLPSRFGRLGRVGDRITLAAPWYPLRVEGDTLRRDGEHRVALRLEGDGEILAAGRPRGRVTRVRNRGPYLPVWIAPEWHPHPLAIEGQEAVLYAPERLYRRPGRHARGTGAIRNWAHIDLPGRFTRGVQPVVDFVQGAAGAAMPRRLVVVKTPTRTELAVPVPGALMISDRLYEVAGLDLMRQFHDTAVRVGLLGLMTEHIAERLDAPADRGWAGDLRAAIFFALFGTSRGEEVQTAEDIVGWAGFNPAVDQLLYAPQVPFTEAYFGAQAGPDRLRESPDRAMRPFLHGARFVAALRATQDEDALARIFAAVVAGERSMRDILDEIAVDRWLHGEAEEVNIRLVAVRTVRVDDGYVHRIELARDGGGGTQPVEVLVEAGRDERVRAVWDAPGETGTLEVRTQGRLRRVRVDPNGVIPQSPEIADGHPRADDVDRLPWRPPVMQQFAVQPNASEGITLLTVNFILRQQYATDQAFIASLERTARGARIFGGYTRYLGRMLDTNRRRGALTGAIGYERIAKNFGGEAPGLNRLVGYVVARYDDRRYLFNPQRGQYVIGGASIALTTAEGTQQRVGLFPYVRANVTRSPTPWQTFVIVGEVGGVIGAPLQGERTGIGGRTRLRGFQTDELLADARAFAVVEYRFTPFRDLSTMVLEAVWLRELQFALFTGGGWARNVRGRGRDTFVGEVGGGVRWHIHYFGVQPGVLSLDVSAPLGREPEFNAAGFEIVRSPVTVLFGFEQYF